jgi:hypothetical protein
MIGTKEETYARIARKIREIPLDKPDSSYEWEELVQKMCDSEDAGLQEIGHKEHDVLELAGTKHGRK